MSKVYNQIIAMFVVGLFLVACSQSETASAPAEGNRTIYGASQKGPFIKGTEVTLYGMDEGLIQTGAHFTTKVDNNRGEYSLKKINLDDRYAWLVANGYYIDELTGDTSMQKISLNSLVDLQDRDHVNINILTHLSFNRIRYLVKNGMPVGEAKRQAENEVLAAFGFTEVAESFDQLDIMGNAEGDAKLLAISLMMLTAANVGEVTSRLASIAMDLEEDGVWSDTALIRQVKDLVSLDNHYGTYKKVRQNLAGVGASEIPDYQKYLDQFASPWDSIWGHCNNQDEVKRTTRFNDSLYSRVICRDGIWKYYIGPRNEGDAPVDTAGKYGTLVDERDGHVYKTLDVTLENGKVVTWMANLLEYVPQNSVREGNRYVPGVGREYYGYQPLDYPIREPFNYYDRDMDEQVAHQLAYGEFVQGVCPDGWHLPYGEEWEILWRTMKNDYQIRELLVYSQYTDSGAENSFDENHKYYVDFEYNFTLFLYDDHGFVVAHTWDWNTSREFHQDLIYPVRCVKNWEGGLAVFEDLINKI